MKYYTDPMAALDAATSFLRGNTRPYVLIGRTRKGYRLIDPMSDKKFYCKVIGKFDRKIS